MDNMRDVQGAHDGFLEASARSPFCAVVLIPMDSIALRIEHGGSGVKRGALSKELCIYSCNYELCVKYINEK